MSTDFTAALTDARKTLSFSIASDTIDVISRAASYAEVDIAYNNVPEGVDVDVIIAGITSIGQSDYVLRTESAIAIFAKVAKYHGDYENDIDADLYYKADGAGKVILTKRLVDATLVITITEHLIITTVDSQDLGTWKVEVQDDYYTGISGVLVEA